MKFLNENIFAVGTVGVSALLAFFAGQATVDNLQIVAVKGINAALLLGLSAGFLKLLRGTKYDVVDEIFDQHNVAAAIFAIGYVLAIALAITVTS